MRRGNFTGDQVGDSRGFLGIAEGDIHFDVDAAEARGAVRRRRDRAVRDGVDAAVRVTNQGSAGVDFQHFAAHIRDGHLVPDGVLILDEDEDAVEHVLDQGLRAQPDSDTHDAHAGNDRGDVEAEDIERDGKANEPGDESDQPGERAFERADAAVEGGRIFAADAGGGVDGAAKRVADHRARKQLHQHDGSEDGAETGSVVNQPVAPLVHARWKEEWQLHQAGLNFA